MVRSDRAYRVAVSHERARAEIAALAGVRYDPDLVARFLSIDSAAWRDAWERAGGPRRATVAA
jgi:response regulator RpfG family c-di-GMP phosphodiesterase